MCFRGSSVGGVESPGGRFQGRLGPGMEPASPAASAPHGGTKHLPGQNFRRKGSQDQGTEEDEHRGGPGHGEWAVVREVRPGYDGRPDGGHDRRSGLGMNRGKGQVSGKALGQVPFRGDAASTAGIRNLGRIRRSAAVVRPRLHGAGGNRKVPRRAAVAAGRCAQARQRRGCPRKDERQDKGEYGDLAGPHGQASGKG